VVDDGVVLNLDSGNSRSYPGTGATWVDISKNGNNGTLFGSPSFSNGIISFDGVDDYVQTASNNIANNSSFTLECWIRITTLNSTYRPLIDGGNLGTGTLGFTLAIDNTNRLFIAANAGYVSVTNSLVTNTWYHVVGTAQLGTPYSFSLYVNGTAGTVFASSTTNSLTNNVTYYRIGQNATGSMRFVGSFPVAKVYNRALTASEISQNFEALRGRYGI
jgi:hypothetical protein